RFAGRRQLLFGGFALDFCEDAKQVAAEDFLHLLGGIAARQKRSGDFRQVGGAADFGGQDAEAVEVGADADVVDAGNFRDVVEVVYQRLKRRQRQNVGHVLGVELAIDGNRAGVRHGLAAVDVGLRRCCVERLALGERGGPGGTPVIVDE